jgi:transposase-like protein
MQSGKSHIAGGGRVPQCIMPSKAKKVDRDVAKLRSIPKQLVELFLTGPMTGEAINEAGIAFKKALIEASLNAELSHHLGDAPGSDKPEPLTNHRNGSTSKPVLTGDGKVLIETPRDRAGSFEPLLARRITAFDDSIVALYARGLTVPGALDVVFPRTKLQTCLCI